MTVSAPRTRLFDALVLSSMNIAIPPALACQRTPVLWIAIILAIGAVPLSAQVAQDRPTVQRGPTITPEVHHDSSLPLRDLPPAPHRPGPFVHKLLQVPRPHRDTPVVDPVLQSSTGALLIPAPINNFAGQGSTLTGFNVQFAPPDTNGAAGPNHYVQTVNNDLAVFNKSTGALIHGPVAINTLWTGFNDTCANNPGSDPIVVYDSIADRWIISQMGFSSNLAPPFFLCVAVSQTPDPTGAYNRYAFSYTDFPDYPKMGVWPDAYYETYNMFDIISGGFLGAQMCAFDRAAMLSGNAATQQCFDAGPSGFGLLPADLDGARQPPVGAPNYAVGLGDTNQLAYWLFHVDWATPGNSTLTGPSFLSTAAYADACNDGTCIPQAGTTQQLDSLGDRVMYRLAYRNFGDHEALVVNHSVTAGFNNNPNTGVRWYELRADASHALSIFQQGTYAPNDSNYRWMGSIAMDQSGNIGLGFSVSGLTIHPQIHYTGRLAGDVLGTMPQGEGTIINGAGSQSGVNGLTRWGDYSSMSVDPSDDCTFFYTNEYIPSTGEFNWATRIATFKFPGCGNDFSISASPSSLSIVTGNSGTTIISTAVTVGAAQSVVLSLSGLPSGATASFNPPSVTTGTPSTLTINAGTAAPGTYTLTITGTGSVASIYTTSVALTVNKADTSTTVTSSVNPSVFGQSVTFTATVSPVAPGSGTPTGNVTFLDGGNSIGTGTLSGGVATFTSSTLALGNHTITTSYAGDGNFNGNTGSLTGNPQVVAHANLSITKTHSGNFSRPQTGATYTITVSNSGGAGIVPTLGTVTVTDTLPNVLDTLFPTAMSGSGWTCNLSTLTCTRSDALLPGSTYPPITLTVNVPADIVGNVTNSATVSGGSDPASHTATDATHIGAPVQIISMGTPNLILIAGTQISSEFDVESSTGEGTLNFSCQGLPAGTTCAFNPANGNSLSQVVNMTLSTALGHAGAAPPAFGRSLRFYASLLPFSAIVLLAMTRKKKHLRRRLIAGATLLLALLALTGCGGGTFRQGGTPAGSFTVTVNATSATTGHVGSTTVNLIVLSPGPQD